MRPDDLVFQQTQKPAIFFASSTVEASSLRNMCVLLKMLKTFDVKSGGSVKREALPKAGCFIPYGGRGRQEIISSTLIFPKEVASYLRSNRIRKLIATLHQADYMAGPPPR